MVHAVEPQLAITHLLCSKTEPEARELDKVKGANFARWRCAWSGSGRPAQNMAQVLNACEEFCQSMLL